MQIKVYEMTSLTAETCDVLVSTPTSVTVDYGDFQLTLTRDADDTPYTLSLGRLQLMTTGCEERAIPQYRPLHDIAVAINSHIKYRRTA